MAGLKSFAHQSFMVNIALLWVDFIKPSAVLVQGYLVGDGVGGAGAV